MKKGNILISSARSGTNYFLSVFAKCFTDAFVVKEIFRPAGDSFPQLEELLGLNKDQVVELVGSNPLGLWQQITQKCSEQERVALAKIFYYHVDSDNALWSHFHDNNRVIHLIRRNPFDVFLSHKVASQTGKWQQFGSKGEPVEVQPLVIDAEELQAFISKQSAFIDATRARFRGADYHEVFYEDLAVSVDECVATISSIMGTPAPKSAISIGLKKQKDKTNADLVSNYDDVAQLDTPLF